MLFRKTIMAETKTDLVYPLEGVECSPTSEAAGRLTFIVMEDTEALGPSNFGTNGEETSMTKSQAMPTRSVTLHMPQSLTFNDNVSYSTPDLGLTGAAASTAWAAGSRAGVGGLQDLARDKLNEFKTGDAKGVALRMLVRMSHTMGGGQLGAAAQQVTRYSINPNFRTQFDNVPIRSFQFDFRMIPKDWREAREIEAIIELFRTEVYPEKVTPFGDGYSIGYKFPNTFQIRGLRGLGGQDLPHGYLPAFLTNVATSYNAESRGFHDDGSFLTYDLSLTFQEIRALSKSDIKDGY